MSDSREQANAAYMAWLNGVTGLLPPDDVSSARSEGGWLAYLAGYLHADHAASRQLAEARAAIEEALTEAERVAERAGDKGLTMSYQYNSGRCAGLRAALAALPAPSAEHAPAASEGEPEAPGHFCGYFHCFSRDGLKFYRLPDGRSGYICPKHEEMALAEGGVEGESPKAISPEYDHEVIFTAQVRIEDD